MKTLPANELKSFEQICSVGQHTLRKAMIRFLKSKYKNIIATQSYIMAQGDIPIALLAHMDTVFKDPPQNIFYDREKNVMWSPEGLGADDRAGVFSILQILKMGYRPTVIFTTDEEIGAVGASKMITEIPDAPWDMKYLVQLDRRGGNDCVFYDCANDRFQDYIEQFGFVTNFGSFTDISVICPQWKIAGVNLSIGYYNEHNFIETLLVGQMFNTINRVKDMLDDAEHAEHFEYVASPYYSQLGKLDQSIFYPTEEDDDGWDPAYGVSHELWREWLKPNSDEVGAEICTCDNCKKEDFKENMVLVKSSQGDKYYCEDCEKKLTNCLKCGNLFMPTKEAQFLCPSCVRQRKKKDNKREH